MTDPPLVAIQGCETSYSGYTKLAIRSYASAFHQNAMKLRSRCGEGRSSLRMIAFGSPDNPAIVFSYATLGKEPNSIAKALYDSRVFCE